MHPIAGRPLVWHALRCRGGLAPEQLVAVIGHGRRAVSAYLGRRNSPTSSIAVQDEQLGTGHAVPARSTNSATLAGTVLVTYGDVPLLRTETCARSPTHTGPPATR